MTALVLGTRGSALARAHSQLVAERLRAAGQAVELRVGLELVTAIARAGADVLVTYLAADAARWLREAD